MESLINCIVIADDLTGANATGALLKKRGVRSFTQFDLDSVCPTNQQEVTIYSTDSRNTTPQQSYELIYNLCQKLDLASCACISKRIDSTLRGNISAEINAMLDCLPGYCAIVVPAFPAAKRSCVGGFLTVDGVMLENTEVSKDLKSPLHTSRVLEILGLPEKAHISMNIVAKGEVKLADKIRKLYEDGVRLIVLDGISNSDVKVIASAALRSAVPFICADPGPFTAEVIWQKLKRKENKILLSIGTIADTTRRQVEELKKVYPVHQVELRVEALLKDKKKEIRRVISEFLHPSTDIMLLNTNSLDPKYRINSEADSEALSDCINSCIADITAEILRLHPDIGSIICTGGDITVSVCRRLGAKGVEIIDEVAPLIACGEVLNVKLKVITKGGMAGDPDAYLTCISYLRGE